MGWHGGAHRFIQSGDRLLADVAGHTSHVEDGVKHGQRVKTD